MGLTNGSTGVNAMDHGLNIVRSSPSELVIALAGNPNVGKSTVFNELTGMNQHTGNWPGKTVSNAQGSFHYQDQSIVLVDIPGCYSLMAHSAEEEVARDFICFGGADAVVVVCDATCLERNLNLVFQALEITENVVVCVNLLDEARKKHIHVDLRGLSQMLGVPVVGTSARSREGLAELCAAMKDIGLKQRPLTPAPISYPAPIEAAIALVAPALSQLLPPELPARWVALRLLDLDASLIKAFHTHWGVSPLTNPVVKQRLEQAHQLLLQAGLGQNALKDAIVSQLYGLAEKAAACCVRFEQEACPARQIKLDRILTSRSTGIPIMLLLLLVVFFLTIAGANAPSALLSQAFGWLEGRFRQLLMVLSAPDWLVGLLADGMFRVLGWVVSVMLPPMAIFFPLFTLLEDLGYLPRVAFNLDHAFQRCGACGKQALSTCMGFGCNACGVIGCRIIDSPRERLIAILTNNFVPCNGRFPTLIALITMFFVGSESLGGTLLSAVLLTFLILLGLAMTFFVSYVLSHTLLKGVPSSFTLELPPYRKPQIGKVIVRSIFDRTLFVLGRAAAVAIPAGILIYVLANVHVGGISLLAHATQALDPFARLLGLDGVILTAFLLGMPANEIVLPIIMMSYLATGALEEYESLAAFKTLLVNNGWTPLTALCTMLFSLMHWPCSTTFLTIRKETQSWKWTMAAFAIPTICGIVICFLTATLARLIGLG